MARNKLDKQEFQWGGTSPFFYHPFISFFTPVLKDKTVLDCGCGRGVNSFLIRTTRDIGMGKIIGIDSSKYYLDFCNKHKIYDKAIKHSLPTIPLPDKSVDFLISTEVIEHLTPKEGRAFLKEVDRVCRGRALITTPNVYFQTLPGEYEDAHHSIWTSEDFREKGYKVYGMGLKLTLLLTDRFLHIRRALYYLASPFTYFFPELSGGLIAVKDY